LLAVTDRLTDGQMPVNIASLLGPDILMTFLRKDYQCKLSSNANERNLPKAVKF
jgi:hypothetical protein